ncbi:MAG: Flp pilus assembly complex ATPase component TadA [Phycisphaeraceae bacterium]|nr:Flp pilus assembly complex ATPase component TadA [Phycisphaeraceae bacterium]
MNSTPSTTHDADQDDLSLSVLWTPEESATPAEPAGDMGDVLLSEGNIDAAKLTQARGIAAKTPGKSLARVMLDLGVSPLAVQQALAAVTGLPFEQPGPDNVDVKLLHRLGLDYCQKHQVLPLGLRGNRLMLGVTDVDDLLVVDEVRHKLAVAVKPVIVCPRDVEIVIAAFKQESTSETDVPVDDIIAGIEEDDVELVQTKEQELDLEKMAGESPVIRFVNYLIFNAVKESASDIHIEPQEKKLQIRYRIDGVLFEMMNPPLSMHPAILSRLKVMANLDISERRLPQDGRIRVMLHGRKLDLRLSTLPLAAGEKAVLRILDTRAISVPLEDLGMDDNILVAWRHQIAQPHGILLVTGPTGSGKTTTLYSSLNQMDRGKLNISTVEDPVEYHLGGINQTQIFEKIGMTFAASLRALLRQDPDVIMIGEIRDAETARIAIQASLTGHLVLSTLHTNDAPSAVTRLINIGVEPYLIGAALNAIIAQRLIRRICPHCKVPAQPDEHAVKYLRMHDVPIATLVMGRGCDRCRGTGYTGRLGLFELLPLDDFLRDKIAANPTVTEFRRLCVERGMKTLREDGFEKVREGRTTVDEILRVTESTI